MQDYGSELCFAAALPVPHCSAFAQEATALLSAKSIWFSRFPPENVNDTLLFSTHFFFFFLIYSLFNVSILLHPFRKQK